MLDLSRLPMVSDEEAEFVNFVLSLPESIRAVLPLSASAGSTLNMPVNLHQRADFDVRGLVVDLKVSAGTLRLWLDPAWLDTASDILFPTWRQENSKDLQYLWRVACILARIMETTSLDLSGLEISDVAEISVTDVAKSYFGTIWVEQQKFGFAWQILQVNIAEVYRAYMPSSYRHTLPFIPDFLARIRLESVEMLLADLRDLSVGDIVLCPYATVDEIPAYIMVRDVGLFRGHLDYTGIFHITHNKLEAFAMSDMPTVNEELPSQTDLTARESDGVENQILQKDSPEPDDEFQDFVDQISVTVDFVLATKRVPLRDLSGWGVGRALALKLELTEPVRIRINDTAVGYGHLIQIGDRVGVQIERWRYDGGGDDG